MIQVDTVPCKICGEPTLMTGSKDCTNCWEVIKRLDLFIQSEGGKEYLMNYVMKKKLFSEYIIKKVKSQ